eukprot:COSAG01_NODE_887_length_12898_cov_4.702395_3_plen_130_part_00
MLSRKQKDQPEDDYDQVHEETEVKKSEEFMSAYGCLFEYVVHGGSLLMNCGANQACICSGIVLHLQGKRRVAAAIRRTGADLGLDVLLGRLFTHGARRVRPSLFFQRRENFATVTLLIVTLCIGTDTSK